ncbi:MULTISPECIES: entericidin EcnA/B family protein [Roseobacteraceae]|nr:MULTISPECIES: entericidin EcnA/B family protein [Roseobacteraceae]ANT59051.1 entericidin EcnA/B family protein [Salipiger sp. CCB-MM3]MCA0994778.1 entericidin EcnA/B family protein [Alloyangia pacifica]NDV99257.1 entericidin EcnA/B family protein [Salipiger sp. PrR002]NDW55743.1 entericidin EcnA/B family protein [Salipiger sp. PrR004]
MKRLILIALLAAPLAACGTVDGFGQDVSRASRTVDSWF